MPAKWLGFKGEVKVNCLNLHTLEFLQACMSCAPDLVDDTVIVTSINDGLHKVESAHYTNDAWDIRTHPAGDALRTGAILARTMQERDNLSQLWVNRMTRKLGRPFQIMYEKSKQHIHGELDRRDR